MSENVAMKTKIKFQLKLLILCLGLTSLSVACAAGFGVSGEQSSATTNTNSGNPISRLLSQNQAVFGANSSNNTEAPAVLPPAPQKNADGRKTASAGGAANMLGNSAVSRQAFIQTLHNTMPLSPQQIKTLRYLFDQSQRAADAYPGTPPRPTSTTVLVNLSPGATPPVIRLRSGYVTSLVFLDSTGQPWPIVAYDLGNPKAFNIEPNQPNGKSDTLLVEALRTYRAGNLAVMLKGQNTPIMLTLMPGQRAVDYRVDLRVPGLGPNAKSDMSGLPSTGNQQLINFLDGVPPNGAKALQVAGGQAEAWLFGGKLYLRTRLTVVSPSWTSSMSSPDGTHVYELMKTPVVLASQRGVVTQLTMKGL